MAELGWIIAIGLWINIIAMVIPWRNQILLQLESTNFVKLNFLT